jgi:hypothetical protein
LAKIKDNRDSIKYSKDTSRVAKRDKFQIESFIKQLEVYKQQLSAIRIQATIAKKQFDYQTVLNKQQLYINRPIFMLIKVEYDTVKKVALFHVKNLGKTPAKLNTAKLFSFNEKNRTYSTNIDEVSKNELNESTIVTFGLPTSKANFDSKETLYYLSFLYTDQAKGTLQPFVKYFYWEQLSTGIYGWTDLQEPQVVKLKNTAKSANLN